jgi:hypothetical protein
VITMFIERKVPFGNYHRDVFLFYTNSVLYDKIIFMILIK